MVTPSTTQTPTLGCRHAKNLLQMQPHTEKHLLVRYELFVYVFFFHLYRHSVSLPLDGEKFQQLSPTYNQGIFGGSFGHNHRNDLPTRTFLRVSFLVKAHARVPGTMELISFDPPPPRH